MKNVLSKRSSGFVYTNTTGECKKLSIDISLPGINPVVKLFVNGIDLFSSPSYRGEDILIPPGATYEVITNGKIVKWLEGKPEINSGLLFSFEPPTKEGFYFVRTNGDFIMIKKLFIDEESGRMVFPYRNVLKNAQRVQWVLDSKILNRYEYAGPIPLPEN